MEPREHSRRHPPRRTAEGGRRLRSAGSAVLVALAALALSLLLNAPGLHKSAAIQPEGSKRDLALAVTRPLERVSNALLLDRPRRGLKTALGRSDDDEIDTEVAAPAVRPPGAAAPLPRRRFSPSHRLGLWIAGDSLVVVPGESLLRDVAGNRAVFPVEAIDGRIASGLERPDVFNWFTRAEDVMREKRPRAVVLLFGGNDDHDFMTGTPEGVEVGTFGSPTWRAEYRRRVAALMDTVTGGGAYLVWIGLPISRDAEQTRRFDVINSIVQTEANERNRRVAYLDTYFFFAGDDGGYAQYVEDSSGRLVKMRADDGVHFERPAGDLIAEKVLDRLGERLDFESWQRG